LPIQKVDISIPQKIPQKSAIVFILVIFGRGELNTQEADRFVHYSL